MGVGTLNQSTSRDGCKEGLKGYLFPHCRICVGPRVPPHPPSALRVPVAGPRRLAINQLGVAHGQVPFEGQDHVAEDGAAEGHVVHRVEEVDEELVVGLGAEVKGLDEGELGHRGEEVQGVEDGHGHEDLVEHGGRHLWPGEHVYAHLKK